jgi:predicted TIM-barrel fold metal-dependent hydrolase
MDGHFEKMGTYVPWLKKRPSEYFIEQCYLTMDPDESTLSAMVGLGVERNVLWGSDYPHFDCIYPGVVKEVRGAISKLPEISQQNILTDNAIRFYNL